MLVNFLRRKIINFVCKGWSSRKQWNLFHEVFSRKKNFKEIALLGVYHGKDLAYICSALKKNNHKNFKIYAVDLFEDVAGADWGEENKHLNWKDLNRGPPPSLEKSKFIINLLGFSKYVKFIKGDFKKLMELKPQLDFVYIDLSHDYETTCDAIDLCVKLSHKNTIIMGDDFYDGEILGTLWGVKQAVKDKFRNYKLHYNYFWESDIDNLRN